MDAVKFIKERDRMCHFYHHAGDCYQCPAKDCECSALEGMVNDDNIVTIVEKWSVVHPRKTRQDVFLEQFPNAPIYTNTHNVILDPCLVDTTLRGHCPTGRGCDTCRREFWMQEVES